MKFLVLWHFDVTRLTPDVVRAIADQPKYGTARSSKPTASSNAAITWWEATEGPGSIRSPPTRN